MLDFVIYSNLNFLTYLYLYFQNLIFYLTSFGYDVIKFNNIFLSNMIRCN